jgi:hypothetical protein
MNKKEDMLPIEVGIPSEIYLSAFSRPKSCYMISHEIHGKDHHRIRTLTKELSKEGYFKPIKIEGKKDPYWLSSVDPLIDKIEEINRKKKIKLTDLDKHILDKILDSSFFRKIIGSSVINTKGDFNTISQIFMILEQFLMPHTKIKFLVDLGKELDKLKLNPDKYDNDMDEFIDMIRNNEDILDESLEELKKYNAKDPLIELLKNEENKQDFMKEMLIFLYIPNSLIQKIRGISVIGQLDDYFFAPFYHQLIKSMGFMNQSKD